MDKIHNIYSQTHKFSSSPNSSMICSVIALISYFHFGWFISCAPCQRGLLIKLTPKLIGWCSSTRAKMLVLVASKVTTAPQLIESLQNRAGKPWGCAVTDRKMGWKIKEDVLMPWTLNVVNKCSSPNLHPVLTPLLT